MNGRSRRRTLDRHCPIERHAFSRIGHIPRRRRIHLRRWSQMISQPKRNRHTRRTCQTRLCFWRCRCRCKTWARTRTRTHLHCWQRWHQYPFILTFSLVLANPTHSQHQQRRRRTTIPIRIHHIFLCIAHTPDRANAVLILPLTPSLICDSTLDRPSPEGASEDSHIPIKNVFGFSRETKTHGAVLCSEFWGGSSVIWFVVGARDFG